MATGTFSAYQKKRARKKIKNFLLFLSGLILVFSGLIGVLAFLTHLDIFQVQTVTVEGLEVLEEEPILQLAEEETEGRYWGVLSKRSGFIYPRRRIGLELVEEFPRIRSLSISRSSLQKIEIIISERQPHVIWCSERRADGRYWYDKEPEAEKCFFADQSGFIFAEAPKFSSAVIFHYYGGGFELRGRRVVDVETFKDLESFRRAVEERDLIPRSIRVIKNRDDYQLFLRPEGYLHFNFDRPWPLTLDRLSQLVWEKEEELLTAEGGLAVDYIDLRYGNRIFYMPKE